MLEIQRNLHNIRDIREIKKAEMELVWEKLI